MVALAGVVIALPCMHTPRNLGPAKRMSDYDASHFKETFRFSKCDVDGMMYEFGYLNAFQQPFSMQIDQYANMQWIDSDTAFLLLLLSQ